jgi:NAD-dependent deacetylase
MIASDLPTAIERLRHLIENASVIIPFTGAGISTECGIPDFRSPGGIWTKTKQIPFDAFVTSQEMRDEAWRRRFAMEESFANAKPG